MSMRIAIWIVSFLAAGWSFPKLIATDTMRRRNFLKGGVPAVDDSYERVLAPGRTYHDLKNVMTEWVRADPQLAAKFLAFVALVGWVVVVLVALVWLAS
jgi:hypothetical protein